jgi:hypothetical protein
MFVKKSWRTVSSKGALPPLETPKKGKFPIGEFEGLCPSK